MDYQLIISTEEDSEFFMELFSEIKSSELHLQEWPLQLKKQLIEMQYFAFDQHVKSEFPDFRDYLILVDENKAGRLQINRRKKELRIINISLSADFRNKGIGKKILLDVISEANQMYYSVHLDVDQNNPAFHLYEQLGFRIVSENEMHFSMEYTPPLRPDYESTQAHFGSDIKKDESIIDP